MYVSKNIKIQTLTKHTHYQIGQHPYEQYAHVRPDRYSFQRRDEPHIRFSCGRTRPKIQIK